MAGKCFSLVRGRAMRVTRLDGCGAVVPGPDSQVTSDGFITVTLTAQIDAGQTISVTNAAGDVCILDEPCPKFTGYDVAVEFCGVDPALFTLMTGQPGVADGTGDIVGFKMNSKINACDSGFALEMWSNVPAQVCEAGVGQSYGYLLIPFLKGGVIGDFTVGNDAVNFGLTGAKSKDGNGWGVGPYDVVADQTQLASPLLEALDPNDHLHVQLTTIAPPDAECGGTAVGVAATGATAGSPATLSPANSWPPTDLVDAATGFTATPATAWTAGQYVTLGDGSLAHWSGTAWAAGAA
jgi:hypothetical protein